MTDKMQFFFIILQYNLFRHIPQKKQQLLECLQELFDNLLTDFTYDNILEIGMEEFGIGGLLLTNLALFLLGFLLMLAADWAIRHAQYPLSSAIHMLSGWYCLDKFKKRSISSSKNLLILLYILLSLCAGFRWTITILFLIVFVNMELIMKKGGREG